jgi:hypothetical protein
VLGLSLTLPGIYHEEQVTTCEVGLVAALGFAAPIGGRAFVYGDALLGFGVRNVSSTDSSLFSGYCGAELELKVVLGSNYLLRLGLRPSYAVGQSKHASVQEDASTLRIYLTLGFSGFVSTRRAR